MHINKLDLNYFRNYINVELNFSKYFNVIYGDNAQGKTNILEAIFLCASGRSHRTSKDTDLVNILGQGYLINLNFIKENNDASVTISFKPEEKKKVKINEIPIKKIGNLMGHFNAVIFSPEDLIMIKAGPSERRRFIDITISQLKPSYFYDLQQYLKVLIQRNSLLKEIQRNKTLIDTLEIWNNHLVSIGARIIKTREEFIQKLNRFVEVNHRKLTNGSENLLLRYSPSIECRNFSSINDIEYDFRKILSESLSKEMIKKTTLYGPQRDDYEILLNNMSLKQYGSQGQQRTAVLSIKLSEVNLMKEETGEYPVILLDDVMSELDRNRQEYLIENLKEIQTFITCTDKNFINEDSTIEVNFINIRNGMVIKNLHNMSN